MTFLVGTRGSALATAQAGDVARWIAEATGEPAELVLVTTHGDVSRESLASLGGTGVFATALREFLLEGNCDLVVHSMKDLPTAPAPGLSIAAVPRREDARDALCARDGLTLDELPRGARVGTGSPRRQAQLRRRRPDIEVVDVRGNVDTRLGLVTSGRLDAVILAVAGLVRLGRDEHITERFDLDDWPTAPAQGALAVEVRTSSLHDPRIRAAVAAIHDTDSALAAETERSVLARLDAGCAAPVGAHASVSADGITATAAVYALDGSEALSLTRSAERAALLAGSATDPADDPYYGTSTTPPAGTAHHLGASIAEALLDSGAAALAPLG
ncbi:hydroxymethylbilane synthase [Mycetocola reblochoni]|uniref:Porphobilinogen deaminase n=2 Tax=Mycetocola reblochoni TaxID=331618 RepID=A0A1R4IRN7_9MICO|nr:hydroxymethylbilane synthase [Mycetocola reblochoni]RLP71134.1 hydroxymethylbilane synthase [Mycetocola reblochoni]SJN22516.1 Porphobilinogen deaminase [Mycetocola reblochoni REB411]